MLTIQPLIYLLLLNIDVNLTRAAEQSLILY